MLTVAIQAGGESRRMGRDKALIPFLGQPMILRVLERVKDLGEEILITTNNPEKFDFLDIPLYPDFLPGQGALGGLYTALSAAQQPFVAVIACDMPFANADLLMGLLAALDDQNADAAVPVTDEGYEPLHAVYRRETCLPAIKAALDSGQRRMISWFPMVNVIEFSKEQVVRYDPDLTVFINANTPEELQQAEQIAQL